jgi:CubicO group peptidase (beta-lactamase class C family)
MVENTPETAAELGIGQGAELPPQQRADNRNWTLAPWNRWSFQRVQQFTRTLRVPRAEVSCAMVKKSQDFGELTFEDSGGKPCTVNEMLSRTWTDGFLVMRGGVVLAEQYFNGMGPDTLHLMMSCSKSFTSALAGIYIGQGVLDPADQLSTYLPELVGTGFEGATLQQALDMRVGVKFSENYDDLGGDWRQCEVATGWREDDTYSGPRDMLGYMQTLVERESGHGGVFRYKSILTDALGLCLEGATGRKFAELFHQHIWNPIGAEQDLVSIVDNAGNAVFEGGFNCCLRDFARFAQMICQGGQFNGQQLVPTDWIDECRFVGKELVAAFAQSEDGEALPHHAYHNQWWVRNPRRGVIMALGIHGQILYIDPEYEFVVAKFSSQPDHDDIAMAIDQFLAFEAIAKLLVGESR